MGIGSAADTGILAHSTCVNHNLDRLRLVVLDVDSVVIAGPVVVIEVVSVRVGC